MIHAAMRSVGMAAVLTVAWVSLANPAKAANCAALSQQQLPDTTIAKAESVPAGRFTPPYGDPLEQLPAFCRITGVIKPTSDSYIRFEVWLPETGWNEKYLGVGNGGFAGAISYSGLAGNLKRGYATGATDTGHDAEGEDASWAYKHPEKVKDFGYRGLHVTTVVAKRLTEAFYSQAAKRSYFDSCSDGGREALMEAQRFPDDFDGILAGAPANYWTHMLASGLDVAQRTYGDPAGYISGAKVPAISAAVLAACDAQDGVKDGVINDPPRCHFDPSVLLCKGPESRSCLTTPQIASLKTLYTGGKSSKGQPIFPGYEPGAEQGEGGWAAWILGPAPGGASGAVYLANYFRYMVLEDPRWNPMTANVDRAIRAADEKTAEALNATNADLHAFAARGGKLILYHGWNDPAIAPVNTIQYYEKVLATVGAANAGAFVRLYMVPGMQHCIGGPGATSFGQLGTTTSKGVEHGVYSALENWVENGAVPAEIVATKYVDSNGGRTAVMTRPLCPYPQVARYKGGNTNEAESFSCTAPAEAEPATKQ